MTTEEKNKMKNGYKKAIRKIFTAAKREYRVKLKTFEIIADALMREGMAVYPVRLTNIVNHNVVTGRYSGTLNTEDYTDSIIYVLDILDIKYQIVNNGSSMMSKVLTILPNQAEVSKLKSL